MICVNHNSQEVKDLAKQMGEHVAVVAAKIGVWQEENGATEWPTLSDLQTSKSFKPSSSANKLSQNEVVEALKSAREKLDFDENKKQSKIGDTVLRESLTGKIDAMPEYSFDGRDESLDEMAGFGTDVHKIFENVAKGISREKTKAQMTQVSDEAFNNIWETMRSIFKSLSLEGIVVPEATAISIEDQMIARIDIPIVHPNGSVSVYDLKVTEKSYQLGDDGKAYRSTFGHKESKYNKHKLQVVTLAAMLEKGMPDLGVPPLQIENVGVIPLLKIKDAKGNWTDVVVENTVTYNYQNSKGMAHRLITLSDEDQETLRQKELELLESEGAITFDQYARDIKGYNYDEDKKKLAVLEKEYSRDDLSKEEEKELLKQIEDIKSTFDYIAKLHEKYVEDVKKAHKILHDEGFDEMTEEELRDTYWNLMNLDPKAQSIALNPVKRKLAMLLVEKGSEALEKEFGDEFDKTMVNKEDMSPVDVWMKTLTHIKESFPELQQFVPIYDDAFFKMEMEREKHKADGAKLFKEVIKERNKELGIVERVKEFFFGTGTKYLDWLVVKNDKTGKPEYLSIFEAKKRKLSKAKMDYLLWARKINQVYKEQMDNTPIGYDEDRLIQMDPKTREVFKKSGITAALGAWLGSNFAVDQVRIKWTDPVTKKETIDSYHSVREKIIQYGNKGLIEKLNSMRLLMKYNFKARRQLKKRVNADEAINPLDVKDKGEFYINEEGKMVSKFGLQRGKNRDYSQDYHSAIYKFIDEMSHIKHMEPLLPYVNAIEHLNSIETYDREEKPNVVKFIQEWKQFKIVKRKKEVLGPELDTFLKTLRLLTSQIVMAFNFRGQGLNLIMGHYNSWRAEGLKLWTKGNLRMMKKKEGRDNENAWVFNKYAMDILRKYKAISIDFDHDPKVTAGKIFEGIAHGLTRKGELSIQGSMVLGLMEEDEFNSFEYNDKGELVVKKGVNEAELDKKMLQYRNRVTDIQGKYSEKDRRNFMNTELGLFFGQFRVWIPDWWKERFGSKYLSYDLRKKEGSVRATWNRLFSDGFAEFKKQIASPEFWKDPNTMRNLRGMSAIALLLILKNANDDDDDKRKQNDLLSQQLGQLLFIFDPHQAEFMLSTPAAGFKTLQNFIKIFEHTLSMEDGFLAEYKADGRYGNKGDLKVADDIMRVLPWNKVYNNALVFPED